ncbi:MAG: hypothetical protein ACR2LQ_02030 [Acidimicrobiales bacterium]
MEFRAAVVVSDGDLEVVVVLAVPANLAVVDALARVQLEARRLGASVRVLDPDSDLLELLDLVGLHDLAAS